jgi:PKD repeat protein
MKKITIVLAIFVLVSFSHFSSAQNNEKCLTEIIFQEEAKKDPSLLRKRQEIEEQTAKYIAEQKYNKTTNAVRIIPIVFHVIHEDGSENISKAQCLDQIRILNEDFRRLNADKIKTPSAFLGLAADCNIEFRLAQKDPNGNCTDGIVRVRSSLTNNASNTSGVKALSNWPSDKYLNFWTVRSIQPGVNQAPGTQIVGFATFPGGDANLDGIVVRHEAVGNIGTAAGALGRTPTHEMGHWLNLRHIWGNSNCGDDFVSDTPTQEGPNQSNCPAFPHITCNNGPNGDMYTNYMDYTANNCQNMFSTGQGMRMDAVLDPTNGSRRNISSDANLVATGTDGATVVACTPTAQFTFSTTYVCSGSSVKFTDQSWNGAPTSWDWSFPGGTPSSSTVQNPVIQYNTPGIYNATLISGNSAGNSAPFTRSGIVNVVSSTPTYSIPFTESFEAAAYPNNDWLIINNLGNANGGNTWTKTTSAFTAGAASMMIINFSGNLLDTKDELVGPTYDLSNVTSPTLTFKMAYAQKLSTDQDALKVLVSSNCGETWSTRYTKSGSSLATAGALVTSSFTPSSVQWRQETVSITNWTGTANFRFKFEFLNKGGNNIYIDDINLNGTVGINELDANSDLTIYPNPANKTTIISLSLSDEQQVNMSVYDLLGREIIVLANQKLSPGEHRFNLNAIKSNGVYFIKLKTGDRISVRKVIYTEE